ncbi:MULTISPECIES: hypothetical protein [Symbiopectobacterium]|uniref:hypothetical protein n=1 Tax=Symbiopectobacterium TaxID=801 RepID=UPI001A1AE5C6|nr:MULTISPECIES: hypothetical protein [Symbiopectobacterium]MBG6248938.1 hypothetical protein [Candidatus Symbiopectobacterium sp. PLON1]MBT9429044.1 hypothetical protein [Candidatus Symbiopectobacterium endolongispinus]
MNILQKRASYSHPETYTYYEFFQSLTGIQNNLFLQCANDDIYKHDCSRMIYYMFEKEVPNLNDSVFKVMTTLFSDSYFSSFYVGDKFLKEINLFEYSTEDAIVVGDIIWDLAINEKRDLFY